MSAPLKNNFVFGNYNVNKESRVILENEDDDEEINDEFY
jgi:hypothetical protein